METAQIFKITGHWFVQSKQLKDRFPQLTENDLRFETGKEDELLCRMKKRLNKNRQEVIDIICLN